MVVVHVSFLVSLFDIISLARKGIENILLLSRVYETHGIIFL